jgi:hypothetical protein
VYKDDRHARDPTSLCCLQRRHREVEPLTIEAQPNRGGARSGLDEESKSGVVARHSGPLVKAAMTSAKMDLSVPVRADRRNVGHSS